MLGTRSGVGTTVIGAALAAAATRRGLRVAVMLPVETGCELCPTDSVAPGGPLDEASVAALSRLSRLAGPPPAVLLSELPRAALRPRDALRLMASARSRIPLDLVNPYRFAPAVEPAAAARLAATEIDLDHLLRCHRRLASDADLVLVEGCGGALCPLSSRALQADLIARLALPVLIVAPSLPGVISDVLLTVDALHSRSITVAGVILNRLVAGLRPEEAAAPLEIERFAGPVVRGVFPHLEASQLVDDEVLARRLEVHVDLAALLG
jgi:dethiobiotin synthetase